jgi:hypothetical protein
MRKVLTEVFGMDNIAPRYQVRKQNETLELDVFAYGLSDIK